MGQASGSKLSDPLSDLYAQLKCTSNGLTAPEVASRKAAFGNNDASARQVNPVLAVLIGLVSNPLVVILVCAAVLSMFLGDVPGGSIIIAIVVVSTAINVVQTKKSHDAMKSLQGQVAPTATAMRDGKWSEVARSEIVPGDTIRLFAGDLVPADCRLVTANHLNVRESSLTGETLPVVKEPDPGGLKTEQPNENAACVFFGTSVVSGEGTALVVRTGNDTVFGDIAARLAKRTPETDFERGLRLFGILILKTVVFLVFFVFLLGLATKRPPLESLMFSVALAVGLTPEFLPMISTITLSRGAVKMSKLGVIVKNLSSIQNLGTMDILCSDKTGTLTTGEMTVDASLDPLGNPSDTTLQLAYINSRLETGVEAGLDAAIVAACAIDPELPKKLGEAPFDFERRRMSIVAEVEGKPLLICKGAPEAVIAACASYRSGDGTSRIDEAAKAKFASAYGDLGSNGFRVLGVATRPVEASPTYGPEDERDLILEGFLSFMDPPIPDAAETIAAMKEAGVLVKIISGDNGDVTRHVCSKVGLTAGRVVLGDEIDAMSDTALQHVAETESVFARISPAQKSRIILALKARSHVVGYMGDGINDAPSLHVADVGISVANAVDVAKESAAVILVKPGLDVLKEGILQGRTASGNVMKYLLMGTSSNFGNMFSMAGAMAVLPFLPMLPMQILLNNFLYDLSQITIPTDNVDPELIAKPRKWDIDLIRKFMVIIGPISSVYDFLTFFVLLQVFHAKQAEFHTGWFIESLATQVFVIVVIRTLGAPWKSRPSAPLTWTILGVVAIACLLPYSPLAPVLGLVPLPLGFFAFLGFATLTYLGLVEIVKKRVFGLAFKSS